MARSITEIQDEIINRVQGDAALSSLTNTSKVAIWRLWTYVIAVSIWTLEKIFDIFRTETDDKIAVLKPHSLRWYAAKAKIFQFGFNLVSEADYYDNTGVDETVLNTSRLVAYAAVVEQTRGLRIKVAKVMGTELAPLGAGELSAFVNYMNKVKDAGVKLLITSTGADSLKLTIDVYYNPLVLNAAGGRADGVSSEPVQQAVKTYLKNLPFNGVFVLQNLVDVLQKVDGVQVIDVKEAQAKYGALAYTAFRVQYIPDAGYLRLYNAADLQLTFIAYSE